MEELVSRILAEYGIVDTVPLPPAKGYRNQSFPARLPNGLVVNLMLFKREPGMQARIQRADAVAAYAYAHGLPVRHRHDPRIIQLVSSRGATYAALYDYLPGHTIPWEAYTQKHIKLLGKYLSDLHAVLADFDEVKLPDVADEYLGIVSRMRQYFSTSGVQQALRSKLHLTMSTDIFASFEVLLEAAKYAPNQQALHMDFVRSNILFGESGDGPLITGILDFEKTAYGSPLFDVARSLAFLLVDCKYKLPGKVRKYFLVSGYQKRGTAALRTVGIHVNGEHIHMLERLLDLFIVYDFYKFLKHNPYESLHENEHFKRTRDILLARHLLYAID